MEQRAGRGPGASAQVNQEADVRAREARPATGAGVASGLMKMKSHLGENCASSTKCAGEPDVITIIGLRRYGAVCVFSSALNLSCWQSGATRFHYHAG